jgi:chloride channel protein, CIC family
MKSYCSGDLLRIVVASAVTGLAVGVLGSLFRAALELAQRWREELTAQAHATPVTGFLATIAAVAAAALLARWLVVRFAPIAAGSGVQHVEAVMRGEAEPAGLAVVPVKFFGGLLAIGAGLPLGREGPTVQMGAAIGNAIAAPIFGASADRRAVVAAGAGTGLAVAFNAPIGGSVFVFEELTRSFIERQMLAALAAAAGAMAIMRVALGNTQLFEAGAPFNQPLAQLPYHFVVGAALGLVGAAYALLTTAFLNAADDFRWAPSLVRAGAIGIAVGACGWFSPWFVGGGETLVQSILSLTPSTATLLLILGVRLVLGPLSYAAGAPGGLFAPLLAIGVAFGALSAGVAESLWPGIAPSPLVGGVVGMSAMFAAVVRAPLTGIVMTLEMTGRADCALAMLTACLAATLFSSLVGSRPIYDVLRERMLASFPAPTPAKAASERSAANKAPTR